MWKRYFATRSCKNGKYLASIIDNLVIMCNEITDVDAETKSNDKETKTIPTYLIKKITCKAQNLYILLGFLLITIALLIAALHVMIY